MEYGAIDLHLRRSQVRIIDADEQVLFDRRMDTTREDFTAVFGGRPRMRLLIESSNPKVLGFDGQAVLYADFLYEVARTKK